MSDELRERFARALDGLLAERNQLRAERDLLLWLHAEAAWQRDQLRVEADHQWTVRRQMGHRVIDADSELTEAVDLARWLLAEMAWQQDVYRQAWARAEVDASIVAAEHQKWAAAIAETAVRLSDAGYHGQLVDSVTRLIADRAELVAERDEQYAQWEKAAGRDMAAREQLTALRASAVQLPESWVGNLWNTLATRIDDLDNLNDAYEAVKLRIESWRTATERNEGH